MAGRTKSVDAPAWLRRAAEACRFSMRKKRNETVAAAAVLECRGICEAVHQHTS
jgi:hypothetical protein